MIPAQLALHLVPDPVVAQPVHCPSCSGIVVLARPDNGGRLCYGCGLRFGPSDSPRPVSLRRDWREVLLVPAPRAATGQDADDGESLSPDRIRQAAGVSAPLSASRHENVGESARRGRGRPRKYAGDQRERAAASARAYRRRRIEARS